MLETNTTKGNKTKDARKTRIEFLEAQRLLELEQQELNAKKPKLGSEQAWESWQAQQEPEDDIPEIKMEIPFTRRISVFQMPDLERVLELSRLKSKEARDRLKASFDIASK
jgi:hypothetical protein